MNQSSDSNTQAIRSDIDETRRRMDGTMDALGERLQPQHLIDEVLGFFRRSTSDGNNQLHHLREKITQSADTAMHSVVETVKKNPMPALLIGAGVAWMIYESRRSSSPNMDGDYYGYDREGDLRDPDLYTDRPMQYSLGKTGDGEQSKLGELKDKIAEKAADATGQVKEKLSRAGEVAREKANELRQQAGEKLGQVRERTTQAYQRSRERVIQTADHHPLELGLACLATGLVTGLLLPTPEVVHRKVGPTADRLRDRTRETSREMMEKGRHVAEAAMNAVKNEARAQGLTPERLRDKTTAVAERATDAARDTARQEGLPMTGSKQDPQRTAQGGSCPT
jgi:ElaB/YqjD/DUF883 family membrane-anchored ribosome-binding protein